MNKQYPKWIWESYEKRPAWAHEATIEEWASHCREEQALGQLLGDNYKKIAG